ncbi:hypothetical protein, partial [Pseudomonas sp. AM8]|uniref:hypothetical protein n=1 Tax=Pseudomonas sp. AM8 TaxID=2983368 RepID=UPI002E7FE832
SPLPIRPDPVLSTRNIVQAISIKRQINPDFQLKSRFGQHTYFRTKTERQSHGGPMKAFLNAKNHKPPTKENRGIAFS